MNVGGIGNNQFGQFATGMLEQNGNIGEIIQERIDSLLSIIQSAGTSAVGAGQNVDSTAPFANPILGDDIDEDAASEGLEDTEKLIATLQADADEKILGRLQAELKTKKGNLSTNYQDSLNKIKDSIQKAKDAEKAAKANRILGIFGAILSVVAAVVVTVCTGGLAAGFAIAGAVLACTSCILDLTGGSKAICKAMSKSLQNRHPEWSKAKCDAFAEGIYGGIFLALSAVCMVGGFFSATSQMKNLSEIAKATVKMIRNIVTGGNALLTLGSLAGGTAGIVTNKMAGDSAADVTDMDAILLELKKQLEESNEDIEKIMESLGSVFSSMIEILEHKTDTENEMLAKSVQMA